MLIFRNVANPVLADGLLFNVSRRAEKLKSIESKEMLRKLHTILQNQRHFLHIVKQTEMY